MIITLGSRGALVQSSQGTIHVPAFLVKAVDTTAAGDAFVAAFSVATCEGVSLDKALLFASAAGALTASRMGAQPSLPLRKELDAYLKCQSGEDRVVDSMERS